MKSRLVRGLAAAALAATIGVAGTAQPAHAESKQPPRPDAVAQVVVFDWVSAAIAVAATLLNNGNSDGAVRQILAAIEATRVDIINHIDAIASAEVQACVEANTIEFANIEFFPPPVLTLWAQSATSCATLATAYVNAVQSPQAVDNLGFLIGPIYAIVLAARAKAGLVNGVNLLLEDEFRAYLAVSIKLGPAPGQCVPFRIEGQIEYYTCRMYNGDTGRNANPQIAWNIAARNTSSPIADAAMPRLYAALHPGG